jgi:hypothetical protein
MRTVTKRTAALSAAVVGIALVGSGCSDNDKDKVSESTSSTSSTSSSVTGAPETAPEPTTAAPSSTEIAGPDGKQYAVSGPILEKYNALDETARKNLGGPIGEEQRNPDGGVYQQFDGGVIVHTTRSYVVWGAIRDKWNELGGSQGKLGYPTSDETDGPDGAKQTTFEHGVISWKQGDEEATVVEH